MASTNHMAASTSLFTVTVTKERLEHYTIRVAAQAKGAIYTALSREEAVYSSYLPPVNAKLLFSSFSFKYSYTVKVTA